MDHYNNIKIGDFGLATTTTRSKAEAADNTAVQLPGESDGYDEGGCSPPKSGLRGGLNVIPILPPGTEDITVDRSVYMQNAAGVDFSEYAILVQPDGSTANRSASAYLWDSLTGGVGTAMYSAPEQAMSSRQRNASNPDGNFGYDSKADMFSLGVILFEMCWKPFSTGMERISVLKDLREFAKLPDEFVKKVPENLCKIIVSLVQKDPAARPSAKDLSTSSLMPGKINIDKTYLREITDSLLNPRSEMLHEIISALFRPRREEFRSTGQFVDADRSELASSGYGGWEQEVLSLQPVSNWCEKLRAENNLKNAGSRIQLERVFTEQPFLNTALPLQLQGCLVQSFCNVFKNHGGVLLAPPLLYKRNSDVMDTDAVKEFEQQETWAFPHKDNTKATTYLDDDKNSVRFLDNAGGIVVLPSNLLVPFCRYAGKLAITNSQRYQVDKVYLSRPGGEVATKMHAAYDIIVPDSTSLEQAIIPAPSNLDSDATSRRLNIPLLPRTEAEKMSFYTSQTLIRDRNRAVAEADVIIAALECCFLIRSFEVGTGSKTSGASKPPSLSTRRIIWLGDLRMFKVLFEICKIPAEKSAVTLKLLKDSFEEAVNASDRLKFQENIAAKLRDVGISDSSLKLLFQFVKVLLPTGFKLCKDPNQLVTSVLRVLDDLEITFYRLPVVIEMRRILVADKDASHFSGSDPRSASNLKPFAPKQVFNRFIIHKIVDVLLLACFRVR